MIFRAYLGDTRPVLREMVEAAPVDASCRGRISNARGFTADVNVC